MPVAAADTPLPSALACLPPFTQAWAYGSSVFSQPHLHPRPSEAPRTAQLDVIVAVADAAAWHAANAAANPAHYAWIARAMGGRAVATLASSLGAGVWFNQGCALPRALPALAPGVPPPAALKYGVVQVDDLVADLTAWTRLFVAGRLHKPTLTVAGAEPASAALAPALAANAAAAAAATLLLLPSTFSDADWRATVAGLSYGGDVRHVIGADGAHKPARIAAGAAAALDALYVPHLVGVVGAAGGVARLAGSWVQDPRAAARGALLARLPPRVRGRVATAAGLPPHAAPADVAARLGRGGVPAVLSACLARTVRASSARQAALGLVSAGPLGAAAYVGAKLAKAWRW